MLKSLKKIFLRTLAAVVSLVVLFYLVLLITAWI